MVLMAKVMGPYTSEWACSGWKLGLICYVREGNVTKSVSWHSARRIRGCNVVREEAAIARATTTLIGLHAGGRV